MRLFSRLLCVLGASAVLGAIPGRVSAADAAGEEANPPLETVVVTASFRDLAQHEAPASVTVLGRAAIEDAGVQHFEDLAGLVPNLNWAGGTSRPRYIQLRGIGERSQYQGAPNPSVGFIIDDIDFSGIGMAATLFDLTQAEVLRGPQGTRYGANALAGLVYLRSAPPPGSAEGYCTLDAGTDDIRAGGCALGGPVTGALGYRLALHRHVSNGFRDNLFLGRDDSNGRDETTARLRLAWAPTDNLQADLTTMWVNLDNGFDAFAIDNGLATRSDKPGRDAQRSLGMSLRLGWQVADQAALESISSFADSKIVYSFDGDWGNNRDWAPYDPYDFFSATHRERRTLSQEFRVVSQPGGALFGGRGDWLAGIYALRLDETNSGEDTFNGALFTALDSDYAATSTAVFGQLDLALPADLALTAGLRVEHRDARYTDSNGAAFSPAETMIGGQLVLSRALGDNLNAYLGLSRGFKAGGLNIGTRIPEARREFDAEYLWNAETGLKGFWPGAGLRASLGVFYMLRRDQQVSTSFQDDPSDPLSFTFYNDNAASGHNLGLESELSWQPGPRWRLFASLGLLRARFDDYETATRVVDGRAQAHAPSYTFAAGTAYQHPAGFYWRAEVTGRDAFYYSDSHDQRSSAYALVNARLGWRRGPWDVFAWGRNLGDKTWTVRGFYFGNEPPDFPDKLYTQQGEPRVGGLALRYAF